MNVVSSDEILKFWFGQNPDDPLENKSLWFKKDSSLDELIKEKFEGTLLKAKEGHLDSWKEEPESRLALLILLDQFSRNIYRDAERAFEADAQALEICLKGMEAKQDRHLTTVQRWFFYMPLMHSESREAQKLSLKVFADLKESAEPDLKEALEGVYQFALRHAEIIERYGRYPHRNSLLNRTSTPEEIEYLKAPGSGF